MTGSKTKIFFASSTVLAIAITAALYVNVYTKQAKVTENSKTGSSSVLGNSCPAKTMEETDKEIFFVGCGGFF